MNPDTGFINIGMPVVIMKAHSMQQLHSQRRGSNQQQSTEEWNFYAWTIFAF